MFKIKNHSPHPNQPPTPKYAMAKPMSIVIALMKAHKHAVFWQNVILNWSVMKGNYSRLK